MKIQLLDLSESISTASTYHFIEDISEVMRAFSLEEKSEVILDFIISNIVVTINRDYIAAIVQL